MSTGCNETGESSQSSRPRRSTRQPAKMPVELAASAPTSSKSTARNGKGKRKAEVDEEEGLTEAKSTTGKKRAIAKDKKNNLEFILTNPKSPIVNLDIFDLINAQTWEFLTEEARERLCKLLPATAFGFQPASLDKYHPSQRNSKSSSDLEDEQMQVDEEHLMLDPAIFSDPHFESAAKTFQDHLYSGWLTAAHQELVKEYQEGIRNGTLHAPWKDDIWDESHPEPNPEESEEVNDLVLDPTMNIGRRKDRSNNAQGDKSDCLSTLVKLEVLKVGDVITYKRRFVQIGITVEKDALIYAIHPKTHTLTLYSTTGQTRDLPASLLLPSYMSSYTTSPLDGHRTLREAFVSTASQLESAILDLDGRVPRDARDRKSRATAPLWKCLTLWRWPAAGWPPEGMNSDELLHAVAAGAFPRGGRQNYGTLFYLRGSALSE